MEINKLSNTRIEVVETTENKIEYEKATLIEMQKTKLKELEEIEELLNNFN